MLFKIFLRSPDHNANQNERNRKYYQCHQRHQPADGQHHHQHTDNGRDRGDNLGQVLRQRIADSVNIVGNKTQDFTVCFRIEVFERHPFYFFRDIFAEHVGDLHRDAGHNIALKKTEDGTHHIQAQQNKSDSADIGKIDCRTGYMRYLGHDTLKEFGGGITKQFSDPIS